jgi:hypothetical protein
MTNERNLLLLQARHALGWGQRQLGEHFGLSRRTIQRWDSRGALANQSQLRELARVVFPHDAPLAERIAQAGGSSLVQLGLVPPPPPPAPPPPPPEAPKASVPLPPEERPLSPAQRALMVDSITCAAADAMKLLPEAVRPALRAAFERARDLQLSATEVASALSPKKTAEKEREKERERGKQKDQKIGK